jgi:hypothetical protein
MQRECEVETRLHLPARLAAGSLRLEARERGGLVEANVNDWGHKVPQSASCVNYDAQLFILRQDYAEWEVTKGKRFSA